MPVWFLVLAMPVCLFIAVMAPTGEAPDEVAHIARVNSLLHGGLLGYRKVRTDGRMPFDAGVTADPALLAAGFTFVPGAPIASKKLTPEVVARVGSVPWSSQPAFLDVPNTAVYMPALYVPAAAGMGMAQAAGFGPYIAILAARLANVLCYAVLGAAALALARHGRLAIFAALTLPMSLWLAASLNQDGLLIAAAALAAAALTRTGQDRRWAVPLAGVAIAAIVTVKPAYAPLALAMLAPLPWRGLTRLTALRGLALAALVMVPAVIWTALMMQHVAVPFVRGPAYQPGPLWPGDPAALFQTTNMRAQLEVFLHRPALLVTLPIHSLLADWANAVRQTIGVLGVLDVLLPAWTYVLWTAALLATLAAELLRPPEQPRAVYGLGAAAIGVAVLGSFFTLFQAQYLSWTLVGQPLIEGVQGRYFLPLIPFVGIALPSLGVRVPAPIRWAAAAPLFAAVAIGLVLVPKLVVTTYYLR